LVLSFKLFGVLAVLSFKLSDFLLELSVHLGEFVGVLGVKLSYEFRVAARLFQRLLEASLKLSNLSKVAVSDQPLKSDSFLLSFVDFD